MNTAIRAATLALSLTLAAGCTMPLNRKTETALNRAVGIEVVSTPDGVALKLPETAQFGFDESTVRADSIAVVDRSAVLLKRSSKPIVVIGYTDNVGPLDYNKQLSEARAVSVGDALVARGIAQQRIRTKGNASGNPVASNATAEGRALNRRTEILVLGETIDTLIGK